MDWNARLSDYYSSSAWRVQMPYLKPTRKQTVWDLSHEGIIDEELDETDTKFIAELERPELRIQPIRRHRIGTEFHGFLSLPREIRDMVYRHLVAPGMRIILFGGEKIIKNARGQEYDRYASLAEDLKPWMDDSDVVLGGRPFGLIQGVCKQIHLEATRVYLRENRFIFPAGDQGHRFWDGGHSFGLKQLTAAMRDVSYAFDMRDSTVSDFQSLSDQADGGNIDLIRPPPRERILELLHFNKEDLLKNHWFDRIQYMKRMNLERLQLAFDEAYCGFGCCRMVEWLCKVLSTPASNMMCVDEPNRDYYVAQPYEWGGVLDAEECYEIYEDEMLPEVAIRAPRVIDIFGWRDDEEKLMIENRLKSLESIGTEQIRFVGQSLAQKQAEWDNEWM
ncbi:hypothetical protein BJ166DRAFT_587584 [Pestalotiopsis sp. NC0098]|nr:hypothetical protein BJ166DRAFT_587584 [Pestalotiopsis sp. NC0098]